MEVQLQELIDRIKKEGIEKAEKTADEIRKKAEEEAKTLIAGAREQAEKIKIEAKEAARRFELTGKQAVSQAGRDLLLKLASDIERVLNAVILEETREALDINILKEIIKGLLDAWAVKGGTDITILLSGKDQKAMSDFFTEKLSRKLKTGMDFSSGQDIEKGFRIIEKDGSSFYDFTDKGIAAELSRYLSAQLKECINDALKDGSGT
ncbi:MAG: hypothetical protein JW881_00610 [Spirochaetales bacterium]|nr:hypothetical protein [Spirochaetales bacterium]